MIYNLYKYKLIWTYKHTIDAGPSVMAVSKGKTYYHGSQNKNDPKQKMMVSAVPQSTVDFQ